ncbi:MAG TPA: PilZ domain-containing protein [Candidatus Hydrogenedentes bacterium]|nr:PilZ domain-containing protein [Candidatus Hydrogenedentota bacterium]HIJ73087.1 PilZ domain-containing protein [Candidatus Hydrogenedentota bacterium]
MVGSPDTASAQKDLQKGNSCFLCFAGRHFLVKVLDVDEETVRVSFSGKDYPIEGVYVDLQFHDEEGFTCYHTIVVEGPGDGRAILLKRPAEAVRNQHRDCCRVSTDLTVQVRDQIHMRKYDAALLNLSTSGAFLCTQAPFDFTTTVEMTLSLPGQPLHTVLAQVMHVADSLDHRGDAERFLGVRFLETDALAGGPITKYIRQRLQELHPAY